MTQKHTQEPWVLFEVGDRVKHFCPASEKEKTSILTVTLEDGTAFGAVYSEEDARRIVACVNACQGLHTEQLESAPLGGILNGAAGLVAQRDELLSALELLLKASTGEGVRAVDVSTAYHQAIIAIAKAKANGEAG